MPPAQRLVDRAGTSAVGVERAEAGIGVGLQRAGPALEVPFGMLVPAVAGEAKQRGGRGAAGEGPVVSEVDPEPAVVVLPWRARAPWCRRRAAAPPP
jgi:hypothetical protein